MNKIKINSPLTNETIQRINRMAQRENTIIVFNNTKGLKPDDLMKLNQNVTVSIIGGLDTKKEKFNNEHYQKRTYYSPKELISIINFFEKIERQLNPLWSELEKCMFVYQKICEYSNYDECEYNGRDAARNLLGVITGKSVCSGYAMIFKEAMDRINIRCYYQNREGHHGWNIVELEGKLYAIELTWDTYNKKDNKCGFRNFCRENRQKFYSNKHHDISTEKDEQEFDVTECPVPILQNALKKISQERIKRIPVLNHNGIMTCSIVGQHIVIKDNIPYLQNGTTSNTFIRSDGSSFILIPTNKSNGRIREYIYLIYIPMSHTIQATRIYSEMDLLTNDKELRNNISNNLLSNQRVARKINSYNGYVGYVEKNSTLRYYSPDVESSLNIYR